VRRFVEAASSLTITRVNSGARAKYFAAKSSYNLRSADSVFEYLIVKFGIKRLFGLDAIASFSPFYDGLLRQIE
jgi:hypothetical protein